MKAPFVTGIVVRVPRHWGSPQVVAWVKEQGWRTAEEAKRSSPACLLSDEVHENELCADWLVNIETPKEQP